MSQTNDQMPDSVANIFALLFIISIPVFIIRTVWEMPLEVLMLAIRDPLILLFFVSAITLFTKTWYGKRGSFLMAFIGGYVHVWILFLSGVYTAYQLPTI